jgi:hypothetical protein
MHGYHKVILRLHAPQAVMQVMISWTLLKFQK